MKQSIKAKMKKRNKERKRETNRNIMKEMKEKERLNISIYFCRLFNDAIRNLEKSIE
jgi:hypothetical protein